MRERNCVCVREREREYIDESRESEKVCVSGFLGYFIGSILNVHARLLLPSAELL